ncbi:TetR/AcrR family transcriptional regulator [Agromyces protaetiae]|nr:TetR/AcrR family transcriptional regulator [Agromyces protaetiae]
MSSATSTRRDARRNHERLLAEAKRLFAERGIDAPLDELATRAGVGAGTVYRHFATREALHRELYVDAVGQLQDFEVEVLAAETGWDAIVQFVDKLSAWVASIPYLPDLMRRVAENDPEGRPDVQFEDSINLILDRAKAEGALRADVNAVDLNVLVDMLGSLGRYGDEYLPFRERQLSIVLDGLRQRPDLTPLPVDSQAFDDFVEMTHRKLS